MNTDSKTLPKIIQGGMGVAVSNYRLARTVSSLGQLGLVSGTALDQVFTRRLQEGDPTGEMRLAVEHFPFKKMAERIWQKYFIEGGKPEGKPYLLPPVQSKQGGREVREICILANFAEVFLAKQGHENPVGINYLEKLQPPHLASAYGAMLAGVDYVVMGAGIPMRIPGMLDAYVNHQPGTYPLYVAGAKEGDDTTMTFDPAEYVECELGPLKRPTFLPIVSSYTLALTLVKKANGRVDGFVIEGPTAGGHNAPPRGQVQLNERGEPIYGERDKVDLEKMRGLGLPFWLAGGFGSAEGLKEALAQGAAGIQVGSAFALCEESGMCPDYKKAVLAKVMNGGITVHTDPLASPTGFPFKVTQLEGSISEKDVYEPRTRVCDLGYLREAYRMEDGRIAFRCPSEPVDVYLAKGGKIEETEGRKCICNALMATIGFGQHRKDGYVEPPVITAGDDLVNVGRFLKPGATSYHAKDVIEQLLNGAA